MYFVLALTKLSQGLCIFCPPNLSPSVFSQNIFRSDPPSSPVSKTNVVIMSSDLSHRHDFVLKPSLYFFLSSDVAASIKYVYNFCFSTRLIFKYETLSFMSPTEDLWIYLRICNATRSKFDQNQILSILFPEISSKVV